MRITLTLSKDDGLLFSAVREAAGMEFVEPAVYARHLFLQGLKSVARSQNTSENLNRRTPELTEAKAKARKVNRKGKR